MAVWDLQLPVYLLFSLFYHENQANISIFRQDSAKERGAGHKTGDLWLSVRATGQGLPAARNACPARDAS